MTHAHFTGTPYCLPSSLKKSCIVILGLYLAGCTSLLDIGRQTPNYDQPLVEAVPKGTFERQAILPYQGPHPRLLQRPEDPWSYPIKIGEAGPVEPYFAGPLTYPFLCQTQESGLGQPIVDNQDGIGVAVYENDNGDRGQKIGYSKDCGLITSAVYFYNPIGGKDFMTYDQSIPIESITHVQVNGKSIPFIVRVEWGTINRYIYSMIALKGEGETLAKPSRSGWNQRLIIAFRGGVGIGFKQGKNTPISMAEDRYQQLSKGYAMVYSSGLQTSNHYNIWESEELALRLKRQFSSLYGKPLYTVGIGASGGGIQQYLLAQNRPGLIDAAVAQYSYPDMVSQTIYALDCDLLEHYFDLADRDNTFWDTWEHRSLVQGLSAQSVEEHEYSKLYQWSKLMNGFLPTRPRGVSECVLGWRGPAQVSHNPKYTHYYHRFAPDIVKQTHWSHWENIKQLYGTDQYGFAHSLWDNQGVQYGLKALNHNQIDFDTFIKINTQVGSWRPQHEMKVAQFWKFSGKNDPISKLNIWSTQNMRHTTDGQSAPRGQADAKAIEGAFRGGMIFTGVADIPIIDVRHYMDDVQDMHHSFASFTTRQRILDATGSAKHQAIWMSDRKYDPTDLAFEVVDKWVLSMKEQGLTIVQAKPTQAQDTCFDGTGKPRFQGPKVWDGAWNNQPTGQCLAQMPNFQSTRQVAGEDIRDITFKCETMSVARALKQGLYGDSVALNAKNKALLERTFPNGVCDYSQPGMGELSAQQLRITQ